ncbi:hypothetical protein [Alteribacillus iranensis]|uniref:Uncharacterized protein n=1 Tax=Alteribacillus iranensis TaxID=930128 RepID=A0A1I1Z4M9_9BACI|nr:hypothetical protein [Alteribacillus iranensis]SFE26766.1 hypothetical protein SAMN05192532_10140 [Alteribacillus iranensis]
MKNKGDTLLLLFIFILSVILITRMTTISMNDEVLSVIFLTVAIYLHKKKKPLKWLFAVLGVIFLSPAVFSMNWTSLLVTLFILYVLNKLIQRPAVKEIDIDMDLPPIAGNAEENNKL